MQRFKECPRWKEKLRGLERAVYWLALEGAYTCTELFPMLRVFSRKTREATIHTLVADTGIPFPACIAREKTGRYLEALMLLAGAGARVLYDRNLRLFFPSEDGEIVEVIAKAVKALVFIGAYDGVRVKGVKFPAGVQVGRHGGIDDQRPLEQFLRELKEEGGTMTNEVRRTKVKGVVCPRCSGTEFTWMYSFANAGLVCLSCNEVTIPSEGWSLGGEVAEEEGGGVTDYYGFRNQDRALAFADGVQAMADLLRVSTEVEIVSMKILHPAGDMVSGYRVGITRK